MDSQLKPPPGALKEAARAQRWAKWLLLGCAGLVIGVAILLLSLFQLLGRPGGSLEETSAALAELADYPPSYKTAGLPRYPEGEVTHLGASSASNETIIYVSSRDGLAQIRHYYQQQLAKAGWQLDKPRSAEADGLSTRIYTRGGQEYHLTLSRQAGGTGTDIIISWH